MRVSERIYRMLLNAYPQRYRRHYESPMAQLFSDQLRAAHTPRKRTALWLRTLADLARTLPARHVEAPRDSLYGLENAQSVPYVSWSRSARKSVFFARAEASSFGRTTITTEDLLLGILREDRGLRKWWEAPRPWSKCGGRLKPARAIRAGSRPVKTCR